MNSIEVRVEAHSGNVRPWIGRAYLNGRLVGVGAYSKTENGARRSALRAYEKIVAQVDAAVAEQNTRKTVCFTLFGFHAEGDRIRAVADRRVRVPGTGTKSLRVRRLSKTWPNTRDGFREAEKWSSDASVRSFYRNGGTR